MKEVELNFKFKNRDFQIFGYENDFLSRVISNGLLWEQHILEFTIEMANSNNRPIFDVGANIGYHSVIWDKICNNKQIVAIEPHPETLEMLKRNRQLNSANFKIVPYAVDKSLSDLRMPLHTGNDSGAMSVAPTGEKVKSLTVDTLSSKFGIPDIVKIDIQGFEPNAILGAAKTIKEKQTKFIIEFYPRDVKKFGLNFDPVFDIFNSCEYRIGFFRPHPLFCIEEITPLICGKFFELWGNGGGTLDLVFMPR